MLLVGATPSSSKHRPSRVAQACPHLSGPTPNPPSLKRHLLFLGTGGRSPGRGLEIQAAWPSRGGAGASGPKWKL